MTLKIEPGTVLQLKGTHSISKEVPDRFNWASNLDGYGIHEIQEGEVILILGLAGGIYNRHNKHEDHICLEIMIDGEYYVINQHKLLCHLYKKVK